MFLSPYVTVTLLVLDVGCLGGFDFPLKRNGTNVGVDVDESWNDAVVCVLFGPIGVMFGSKSLDSSLDMLAAKFVQSALGGSSLCGDCSTCKLSSLWL